MLALLGESPLNTLDEDHSLVSAGLRLIRVANGREQGKSWWFNKEVVRLSPDPTTGYIVVPDDAIRVDPTNGSLNYVLRGRKLYQPYAGSSVDKYKFTQPVDCWLVRLVPFEDLPHQAQLLVSYAAQLDFTRDYDADPSKVKALENKYTMQLIECNAEHTRNRNVNLLRRPSTMAALNGIGMFANPGGLPLLR